MQEEISFGEWLRKQRRALDLTRQAFADQVGCAEVTLRRIESGVLKPSKELAGVLLEKLGIPKTEWPQWIQFARGLANFPEKDTNSSSRKSLTNLPASITTFIGREKEQSDVIGLINKHRLVTLTGSGGVGKTRFAIKVGEPVLENYADGVWLLELASLSDPVLLPQTAATLFGLRTPSGISHTDLLIKFLREKSVLLILDNCEHLLDACARLVDTLLKNCPRLKILVTSREPLGITGEAIYRVPSLGLPNLTQLPDMLEDFESVKLFEERAQLVQYDFSLTLENAPDVAQICRRLDGIPLAIELAAAKVNMLSTDQIAKQLDESFDVLTSGSRTTLPRHQTLRASMNWSWGLLTEAEQKLMCQLSVFADGWILEAAQAVCHGDVSELTHSLVKKSLIGTDQKTRREPRYRLHETIRQYAREKLLEAGDSEIIRDKHLVYFVKLVEQAEPELYRSNQVFWLNKLDDELADLRMALKWALATDVESGLRLIVSARFFWEARGDLREVEGWLAQFLEHYQEANSVRAQALVIYGKVLADRGNFTEAQKIANQSLELSQAISDKQAEAFSLWGLGVSFIFKGAVRQGTPFLEQSLALYKSLGDKLGQATVLDWLAMDRNDPERSKGYILESLKLYRELGHLTGAAMCLMDLVDLMIWGGDFSSPIPLLEEARIIYRQIESQVGEAWALMFYGHIAVSQSDYQQAYDYFQQSTRLYEKVGVEVVSAWPRVAMASALLRQGNIVQARETFELSLQQFQKGDAINGLIQTIEGFASLCVNQGQPKCAARLFAWADAMHEKIGDPRPPVLQVPVNSDLALIHSQLNDAEFAKFSAEGRTMTVEQAIALALEPAEEI